MNLRTRFPHLAGDLRGAFFSILVGLPYSITAGMLAFAPFGPAYMANGMVAGIASAVVAGIVNALTGGTPCQISGPRGSVAVLMAGVITAIAAHPALATGGAPDVPGILGIALLCVGASGVLQVVFGLLRFGAVIRFLPYPVISGFMVALGLLVVWPQIPAFLGATAGIGWEELLRNSDIRWGAIAVGATTVYCFIQSRRKFPSSPAPLIAILAGAALHYSLLWAFGREVVGVTGFATLVNGVYPPHPWELPRYTLDRTTLGVVASLLPAIVTIAFIGSMESLLSSSVVSIASQMRFNSNRELIAQGLSNVAVAAVGGAVSCGAPFRGVVNYNAGGRTRLSGVLHSVMAIPMMFFALPVLLFIPIAVLCGVLIVAGWDVVATWYKRLAACPRQDITVGVLVMAATLLVGTAPAILFGIIGAMFLYVRNTSRAPLRGHYDGALRRSMRVRPEQQAAFLRSLGTAIRIVDVQGALFFGTADRFGRDVEDIAEGCRHLILDMRHVNEIDPTGALVLMQTMRRLGERGIHTAVAAVSIEGRRGTVLARAGLDKVVPPERWFEDADLALEHAENMELKGRWPDHLSDVELPLSEMDVCSGMSETQITALERHLRRVTLPAGSELFREGDAGDRLYLLARGEVTVSIKVRRRVVRNHRLGTYCPGVVLGEMAVLERKERSADAVVVSDCVLYEIDGSGLERIRLENPGLHSQFMLNLTRQVVGRLRSATLELRVAYS